MPSTLGIVASGNGADLNWTSVITADAPYGWWKLDETSGNLVQSGSVGGGSSPYGSTVGLTRNQTGIVFAGGNKSFTFSSTATTWNRQNVTNFGTNLGSNNANSFEMVFKITNSAGKATLGRQRADALGWGLYATVGSGNIYITAWAKNIFDQGIDINTGIAWDSTKWYHVVYTWAQTEAKLYINGNLISTKTYASTTGTNDNTNNCDLFSSFGGGFDNSRYCYIDEMLIYKSTLTATQVATHAAASGVLYQ